MTRLEEDRGKRAVNVQFDSEDYEALERAAKADGRKVASLVRAWTLRGLADEKRNTPRKIKVRR